MMYAKPAYMDGLQDRTGAQLVCELSRSMHKLQLAVLVTAVATAVSPHRAAHITAGVRQMTSRECRTTLATPKAVHPGTPNSSTQEKRSQLPAD